MHLCPMRPDLLAPTSTNTIIMSTPGVTVRIVLTEVAGVLVQRPLFLFPEGTKGRHKRKPRASMVPAVLNIVYR